MSVSASFIASARIGWTLMAALVLIGVFSASAVAQGTSYPIVTINFEGNEVFGRQELLDVANRCIERYRTASGAAVSNDVDACLREVRSFIFANGYLRATFEEPEKTKTEMGLVVTVRIDEGVLYRIGQVRIEGAAVLPPSRIRALLRLKTGDVANAETINDWVDGSVQNLYWDFGYVQSNATAEPIFLLEPGAKEGIVNITLKINEGERFSVRSIIFDGLVNVSEDSLLGEMLLKPGDIFSRKLLRESLERLDQSGQFETIDKDKDVDYRSERNGRQLDVIIHLKNKTPTLRNWERPLSTGSLSGTGGIQSSRLVHYVTPIY
jgi:outer membrane protein insertion porin family